MAERRSLALVVAAGRQMSGAFRRIGGTPGERPIWELYKFQESDDESALRVAQVSRGNLRKRGIDRLLHLNGLVASPSPVLSAPGTHLGHRIGDHDRARSMKDNVVVS